MPTTTIDVLIGTGLPIVVALAVALYHAIIQLLPKNKAAQVAALAATVHMVAAPVVQMVEQTLPGVAGETKKAQAVTAVSDILAAGGLKVAPALVNAAIESVVYGMNQGNAINVPGLTTPALPEPIPVASVPGPVAAG